MWAVADLCPPVLRLRARRQPAGRAAMDELEQQTRESLAGEPITMDIFPFQVPLP